MFMGEYNHTIDTKGRLIIPSKFREQLGDEFIVTKGLDGCLFVFPKNEWELFEEKLRDLPLTQKNARKFVRFLCGRSEFVRTGQAGENSSATAIEGVCTAGQGRCPVRKY